MPIYEFRCKACDKRFEALCSMGGNGATCPDCGSGDVKKLMSGFFSRSTSSDGGHSHAGGKCAGCGSGNCGNCH